jgi:hypothetical protein
MGLLINGRSLGDLIAHVLREGAHVHHELRELHDRPLDGVFVGQADGLQVRWQLGVVVVVGHGWSP